jgi:hypothetical protein
LIVVPIVLGKWERADWGVMESRMNIITGGEISLPTASIMGLLARMMMMTMGRELEQATMHL